MINKCRSNEYGTPFLKAMFQFAFDHFNSSFYGYVNADILLDSTLIDSLKAISRDIESGEIFKSVYIVGQRTNVQQEMQDQYTPNGNETPLEFVTRMLLKGHRYWDSAVVGLINNVFNRIIISLRNLHLIGKTCLIL